MHKATTFGQVPASNLIPPATKGRLLYVGNFVSWFSGSKPYSESLSDTLESNGWKVTRTSRRRSQILRGLDMMATAWAAAPSVEAVLVDVFSTRAFIFAEAASRIAGIRGVPVVLMLRGGNLLKRAERSPSRVRSLFKTATVITTPSRFLQEGLAGYSEKRIVYIPDGLDVQLYDFKVRSNPRPRLVWLRALHAVYAPEVSVRAVALLKEAFPDIQLLIVGPDRYDGSLAKIRSIMEKEDLQDSIKWIGGIDKSKVPAVLQEGDVFLNTTTAESFGGSVMEAGACGQCIVTTDSGELASLWKDGVNALVVPVNSPRATADAVTTILHDRNLAEKISRNARATAERFDWSVILPIWERHLGVLTDQD